MDKRRRNGSGKALTAGFAEAVAGRIDLQHEERHPGCALALKHGEPVRRLFEGDPKARPQHIDVIARTLGRGVESGVRHHQRMRRVTREFETPEPARLVGGKLQGLQLCADGDLHADEAGLHRNFAQLVEG